MKRPSPHAVAFSAMSCFKSTPNAHVAHVLTRFWDASKLVAPQRERSTCPCGLLNRCHRMGALRKRSAAHAG